MDCPKGTFPNPVKTKTYPGECENRRRCPDNYRKTKRKGCIRKSARVYKKKSPDGPEYGPENRRPSYRSARSYSVTPKRSPQMIFTQAEIDLLRNSPVSPKSAKKKTPAADDPYDNAGLMDAYINTPKKSATPKSAKKSARSAKKSATPKKSWMDYLLGSNLKTHRYGEYL